MKRLLLILILLILSVNSFAGDTLTPALNRRGLSPADGVIWIKGTPGSPINGDIREKHIDGVYKATERYNGTITDWETIAQVGGSITVPGHVIVDRETLGVFSVKDGVKSINIGRTATFSDGVILADVLGPTYIGTTNSLIKFIPCATPDWEIVQPDDSKNSTGTSFSLLLSTGSEDGYYIKTGKIKGVTLPAGVKVQAKVYLQTDLVNPVWQSISDIEFAAGNGVDLDESTGIITVSPAFYPLGSTALKYEINFSESVTLQGSTTDGTDIYFEQYVCGLTFYELETVNIGEVRMFDLSRTGCATKAELQVKGWAICDGTTPVSQGISDPVITTTPNLEEKFIRMSTDETSGTTGGEATHVLTVDEIPAHTHTQSASLAAGVDNTARMGAENGYELTSSSTGGGEAHNNLPPFYELVYFIRVK